MLEINDDNTKVSARMDAKRRDATWYGEVYHRANVQNVIAIEDQPDIDLSLGNQLPYTRFYPMWNVDFAGCSSKQDSRFLRSIATRDWEPSGAAPTEKDYSWRNIAITPAIRS